MDKKKQAMWNRVPMVGRVSPYKILFYGNFIEVFIYEKPVGYNLESNVVRPESVVKRPIQDQEIFMSSIMRTRNNVIRLVNGNCWQYMGDDNKPIRPIFVSFTFRDHITNVEEANKLFTNYIKRLNWHYFETKKCQIQYVAVIEFTKKDRVHFHAVFFNLPNIDPKQERKDRIFQNIWKHGFTDVKFVEDSMNVGLYIAKYMTKAGLDKRLLSKKRYFCSRGLKRAKRITKAEDAREIVAKVWDEDYIFDKKTESKYYGKMRHRTYKLEPEKLQEYLGGYTVDE